MTGAVVKMVRDTLGRVRHISPAGARQEAVELVEDLADTVGKGVEASAEGALIEAVLVDGVPDGSVGRPESGLGNNDEPPPFGIELVDPVEEVSGGIAVTGE